MHNPSIHESNKLLRVLNDKPLKFTVRIHQPGGNVVEFQADSKPSVKFFEEDRCLWLFDTGGYGSSAIMKWIEGSILLCEENPK